MIADLIKALVGIDDINIFWKQRDIYLRTHSKAALLITKVIRRRYGCGIPVTEKIQRFSTPHGFYGIFISQEAIIKDNCTIYQQVTIGSNNLKNSRGGGYPVIGNGVLIGAGAKVIGGVSIGDNVRIGANAIVVEDVSDNCTVVMEKPRIIQHNDTLENSLLSHSELLTTGGKIE